MSLPEYSGPTMESHFDDAGNLQVKVTMTPTGRWKEYKMPVEAIKQALARNRTDSILDAYMKEMQRALDVACKNAGCGWSRETEK